MSVAFNLDEDSRFLTSLESLDKGVAYGTVSTLERIQDLEISWEEFVSHYGWNELPIAGSDTYPGANQLHSFRMVVDDLGTIVEVVGFTYENQIIVCSVARLPT